MSGYSPRRRLLSLALLSSIVAGAACGLNISTDVEARDEWTRSYPISDSGALTIVTGNGKVVVETADIKTIEIWAERIVRAGTEAAANEQLKAIDMHEEATADRVSIDGSTKGLNIRTSRRINYVVKVPRTIAVTLESSNGDISVTGLSGAFRATASNGRIVATGLSGKADATTTNGIIELTMAAVTADVSAETTNGQVTVTVPRNSNANLSARVTNGEITHDNLDVQVVESSRRRLDGRIGSGGPSLRIETTNGAVRIVGSAQ